MEKYVTHGRELTGEQMAHMLDEFVNGAYEEQVTEFIYTVTKVTHRTLQQKIMGLFIKTIEAWADLYTGELGYDDRNKATIHLAHKIIEATGDKYDRYLPLI